MEERLSENRWTADTIRTLLLLGVMQTGVIAIYLVAARGAPGPLEAPLLAVYAVYPFVFAAIVPRLSPPLVERAGATIALGSPIAIVAVTDGLRSPFLPVFMTIPCASFSASAAAGLARLGVGALLGLGLVTLLEFSGSLPAYGIDPVMLPRARVMLLSHSLAVMIILALNLETARRSSLRELARACESAEAENEAKSDFLAMISHELRTPLTGLAGALDLALEETKEPETRARLRLATSCAESLRALLDELLDLSQIEAGQMTIRPELLLPAVDGPDPESGLEASQARPTAQARPTTVGRPLRVLIAEDTPILRQVIASLLHREGCTTVFASDGHEAVRALEAEAFDLVLMDVHMPELDGLEATRRIRALGPATATLPIYGLSAGAFASDKEEALSAGMTGYLVKPVQAQDLQALLATIRSEGATSPPPTRQEASRSS